MGWEKQEKLIEIGLQVGLRGGDGLRYRAVERQVLNRLLMVYGGVVWLSLLSNNKG
jgi:hypothetical protein